jgi:hypothetical protein
MNKMTTIKVDGKWYEITAIRIVYFGEVFLNSALNAERWHNDLRSAFDRPILRELRPDEVPADADVARAQAAGNDLYLALQTRVTELEALASRLKQRAETAEAALAAKAYPFGKSADGKQCACWTKAGAEWERSIGQCGGFILPDDAMFCECCGAPRKEAK